MSFWNRALRLGSKLVVLLAGGVFTSLPSIETRGEERLPNMVLMLGDDHGWEETGYNGHPHLHTPNLDEMATKGLRMNRFHAAHPTCSPTRASFLTGRHPNRCGTFAPGWSFRPEEITIARLLATAGYRCGHFGKWHVGPVDAQSPTNPRAMGFHHYVSHDNFFELDPMLSRDGAPPVAFPGESSAILIDEAKKFIDQSLNDGAPFLAVIWFGSPHEPYSGLPEDLARYDSLVEPYKDRMVRVTSHETGANVVRPQGEVLRERYAEITAMDRAIGTLRQHLADREVRENTLVFYCGDNGTSSDASRFSPHRGAKAQFYNGGTLVPCVAEWPSQISIPTISNLPASTSDLLPTLCAIAGVAPPKRPLDGIDLFPLLKEETEERPVPLHFWGYPVNRFRGLQLQPWIPPKLQQGTTPLVKKMDGKMTRDFTNWRHPDISQEDYGGTLAIIDNRFKLLVQPEEGDNRKVELFDLIDDPAETTSVAETHPEVVKRLQSKLLEWQTSVLQSLRGGDY